MVAGECCHYLPEHDETQNGKSGWSLDIDNKSVKICQTDGKKENTGIPITRAI